MLRASVAAEKAGVRSVSIVGKGFAGQARLIGQMMGIQNIAIAEYPGVIMNDDDETFRARASTSVVDQVAKGLASQISATSPSSVAASPREIVFTGSLHELLEHFYEQGWTDGLPIVPPTVEAVEEFLRFTPRRPDEVLGVLLPSRREATVWSVAVHGVMAGCRPEYMPILVAAVESIADPEFRVEDAGSTPGWEPLVLVSGPIAEALGFNYGQGVLKVGRRANTSVGRFLRLYMRNIAGHRIPVEGAAAGTDKACIGYTFNVALAENEEAVRASGWRTFGEEHGFSADDNLVTVRSVTAISQPIYVGGHTALEVAERIADVWGPEVARRAYVGLEFGRFHPLLIMSPSLMRVLAAQGWGKDNVKQYLREHVKASAVRIERDAWNTGITDMSITQRGRDGTIPSEYGESDDPQREVPVFVRADWIDIVVAGDPDRNQARGYVNNHRQGPPVTKRVQVVGNGEKS